jgi:ABC-type uncharacterized transport system ATPase subunit
MDPSSKTPLPNLKIYYRRENKSIVNKTKMEKIKNKTLGWPSKLQVVSSALSDPRIVELDFPRDSALPSRKELLEMVQDCRPTFIFSP